MDIITNMGLTTAGELALISFLVGIVVQGVKKMTKVPSELVPVISMVLGIIVGVIAVVITKDTNYLGGGITGLIVGATTSGLVDVGSGVLTTIQTAKASANTKQQEQLAETVKALVDAQTKGASQTQSNAVSMPTSEGVVEHDSDTTQK